MTAESKSWTVCINGIEYTIIDSYAFVTKFEGNQKEVEIAEYIEKDSIQYPVREIRPMVFSESAIEIVDVPSSLEIFRKECFRECKSLRKVCFREDANLIEIDDRCFRDCISLSEFHCPDSVRRIGVKAFRGCSSLTRFTLTENSSIRELCDHAFKGCSIEGFRLTKHLLVDNGRTLGVRKQTTGKPFNGILSISENDNKHCILEAGFLMSMDRRKLIQCFSNETRIQLPDTIHELLNDCFINCRNMEVLVISENSELGHVKKKASFDGGEDDEDRRQLMKMILTSAMKSFTRVENRSPRFQVRNDTLFDRNKYLVKSWESNPDIVIPDSALMVNNYSFYRNNTIRSVRVNEDAALESIGYCAFKKSSVEEVYFNNKIVECRLSGRAFAHCSALKSVVFGHECLVSLFQQGAFMCTALTRICIPRSLKVIQNFVFSKCRQLKEVTFEEDSLLTSIGEFAFSETALTHFKIPVRVKQLACTAICDIPEITIDGQNQNYTIVDKQFLVENGSGKLITYFGTDSSVVLPACIKVLPARSLYNKHFTEVSFAPESQLRSIEPQAFQNGSVEQLQIPNTAQSLLGLDYQNVKSISVDVGNPNLDFDDNFVLSTDNRTLIRYFGSSSHMEMPAFFEVLGQHGFWGYDILRTFCCEEDSELTTIGNAAFSESSLVSATIPELVTSIGSRAFLKCTSLYQIVLRNSLQLTNIGAFALSETSLRSVFIPDSVEVIPNHCFYNCLHLKNVEFGSESKLRELSNGCFCGCISLRHITIPTTVTDIKGLAFLDSSLESIEIPHSVERCGPKVFEATRTMHTVVFQGTAKIDRLIRAMFYGSSITSICIPKSVVSLDNHCFKFCTYLEEVTFEKDSNVEKLCLEAFMKSGIKSIEIPKKVTMIEDRCFAECSQLTTVTFAENSEITVIAGMDVFRGCELDNLVLPESLESFCPNFIATAKSVTFKNSERFNVDNGFVMDRSNQLIGYFGCNNRVEQPNAVQQIKAGCFASNTRIHEIVFSPKFSAKSLFKCVFNKSALRSVAIPDCITAIHEQCFSGCSMLEVVSFGAGSNLESIRENAFAKTSISCITIPSTVRLIADFAFKKAKKLQNVIFTDDSRLEEIGSGAFSYTALDTFVMPRTTGKLGNCCFFGTPLQKFVIMEDSKLKELTWQVFDSLDELCVPEHVIRIHSSFLRGIKRASIAPANSHFSSDEYFLYDQSRTKLAGCFDGATKIVIPREITVIDRECFSGLTSLQTVVFQDEGVLTSIMDYAFKSTMIMEIVIPASVTALGKGCFDSCLHLRKVEFMPSNPIAKITVDMMHKCTAKLLVLSNNVADIEPLAFRKIHGVRIPESNPNLKLIRQVICKTNGTVIAGVGNSNYVCIPKEVKELGRSVFMDAEISCLGFEQPSSLKRMGNYAFRGCKNLISITIPKSVEEIGPFCFDDCTRLKYVQFEEESQLKTVGEQAFTSVSEEVVLPRGIQHFGGGAFSGIRKLRFEDGTVNYLAEDGIIYDRIGAVVRSYYGQDTTSHATETEIVLPEHVEIIAERAFQHSEKRSVFRCASDNRLKQIGDMAFMSSDFHTAYIPESVETIGYGSFAYSCLKKPIFMGTSRLRKFEASLFEQSKVQRIIVPAGVETIGRKCFYGAQFLMDVSFAKGSCLVSIEDDAFVGTSLSMISFPPSLKKIGRRCFQDCRELENIGFLAPHSLRYIGEQAFQGDDYIECFPMPSTIQQIGKEAFSDYCEICTIGTFECQEFEVWMKKNYTEFRRKRSIDFYKDEDFRTVKCLGSGSYGKVDLIENKFTGEKFAVKSLIHPKECTKDRFRELVQRELDIMKTVTHPCIVRLLGYNVPENLMNATLCMEYLPVGSLKTVMDTKPAWFDATAKSVIAAGIALGMSCIHEKMFIHRDLKPDNVLIDARHLPKISDFGTGRDDSDRDQTRLVGTQFYMAPEIWQCDEKEAYTNKVDVYSYGLILYELVEEKFAFPRTLATNELTEMVENNIRPEFSERVIPEVRDLIERCWDSDPTKRPTFENILADLQMIDYTIVEDADSVAVINYVTRIEKTYLNAK